MVRFSKYSLCRFFFRRCGSGFYRRYIFWSYVLWFVIEVFIVILLRLFSFI